MSADSRIEWTDATWNPVYGCTRVSEGCRHCYAERFAARFPERFGGVSRMAPSGPRWTGQVVLRPEALEEPLRWRKPRRIFVCSMSDLFHEQVPDEFIAHAFQVMAQASHHTFQVLTKRPRRMLEWFRTVRRWEHNTGTVLHLGPGDQIVGYREWPLPNVWVGVSAENQQAADERIPLLLQVPAVVRFVSCEPLLGPIDLTYYIRGLAWIVVGGESGPGARPMHPAWVRSLRDQATVAGVPFFFKQWGEWAPLDQVPEEHLDDLAVKELKGRLPEHVFWKRILRADFQDEVVHRVGRTKAGRLLDGRLWDEFPGVPAP